MLMGAWRDAVESPRDAMHQLSYDELASGEAKEKKTNQVSSTKSASFAKKVVVSLVMAATLVLIAGWVAYLVNSRTTVAVNNSVINGNYMPVNTPHEGQLTEVLVTQGAEVSQGDVLARLSNEDAELELALVRSKLARALSEAEAYQREKTQIESLFIFNRQKVRRDLKVAEAEMEGAKALVQSAAAQMRRLQPLIDHGNVALADVEEARALMATAQAEQLRCEAVLETLRFASSAAEKNVVVSENGALDPLGELRTKIALAEAAVQELEQAELVLASLAKPIELHSPSDGTIYAIYHGQGETLKVAEQMLAVSADEGGWATGHVQAWVAPEIRPGQPVEVEIPSMGITTTGIVEGVGHRAVYGRGGYSAEFRGGPLEVPIRVAIDLDGQPVPSGLRLHMTVRLRDPLNELKTWVNQKLATYWYQEPTTVEPGQTPPRIDPDQKRPNGGPVKVALSN
jgi:multidrug resistance efflux pump